MIPSATVIVTGELGPSTLTGRGTRLTDYVHAIWTEDPRKHATSPGGTANLDGVVLLGGKLHIRGQDVLDSWRQAPLEAFAQRWGNGARQAGCAYIWDEQRQQLAILPDPLGGATLFHHTFQGVTVWSTDYRELMRTLTALGATPRKDPDYQIERLILGNGGLTRTSYVGGDYLPVFHGLLVSGKECKVIRYDARRVLYEPRSYVASAEGLRVDVLDAVAALAEAPVERVAHLTGGLDSRMVLGATLQAGVQDEFKFFCSGPPGSPDRDIADGLTRALSLSRTGSGGLTPVLASDHGSQRLQLLNYMAGLSTVGPTGNERQLPLLVSAGGYGELMRPFHRTIPTASPSDWRDPVALMQSVAGRQVTEGFIARDAVARIGRRLSTTLLEMHNEGIPLDFIPNVLYLSIRNRFLVGAKALAWSRVGIQVNPLYSVHAIAGAASLSPSARDSNVFLFDFLASFGHDLTRYPFDKNKFGAGLKGQRRVPRSLPLPSDGEIEFSTVPTQVTGQVGGMQMAAQEREFHIKRANAHGVPFWQSVQIEAAQAELAQSLEESSSMDLMFRTAYLQDLARTGSWTKTKIRNLHTAALTARWWTQQLA